MNAIRRRVAVLTAAGLVAACAWACQATRNRDGTFTVSFAPDMTITAFGLEDTLSKLADLLKKCLTGNYERPCTQAEMDEINEAIGNVLRKKGQLPLPDPPQAPTIPS